MATNNSVNANSTTPLPTVDGGTGVSSPTAHGILVAEGASAFTPITLTNGQLLIGSTGADPVAASLTAGTNITITPAAGGITIAASGGGSGFTSVTTQAFTASGTYTPTSGMLYCQVYCCGAGGGGGLAQSGSTGTSAGSGGNGGGASVGILSAATVGASLTITIGAGGAGSTGGGSGNGGNTTVGSTLLVGGGGVGGMDSPQNDLNGYLTVNLPGQTATGTGSAAHYFTLGGSGGYGLTLLSTAGMLGGAVGGAGGSSMFSGEICGSSLTGASPSSQPGEVGQRGSGGSGGSVYWSTPSAGGGNGGNGYVYIIEYI